MYFLGACRQCSECDQASSDEADIAMETLPDGTKRSRRQIKGPIKFIPQEMSPEPRKHQVRGPVCVGTLALDTPLIDGVASDKTAQIALSLSNKQYILLL